MSRSFFFTEVEKSLNSVADNHGARIFSQPFLIHVGSRVPSSNAGQVLIHSLVSQMARLSRKVAIEEFPDHPLLVGSLLGKATIRAECEAIVSAFREPAQSEETPLRIFVGADQAQSTAGIYVGINKNGAFASESFIPSDFEAENGWDAAIASCLCAGEITKRALFGSKVNVGYSNLEFRFRTEHPIPNSTLQEQKLLMLGFGAVGSNFFYWEHILKLGLRLKIVEGDKVEPGNAARSLIFFPHHCIPGEEWMKVEVATSLSENADIIPQFFDEDLHLPDRYDMILCLANERDVRRRVSTLHSNVILHATTGQDWSSHVHRHIKKRDDCVHCRTGDIRQKSPFLCSSGEVSSKEGESDAAMPFLSALSALMLLIEVVHFSPRHLSAENAVSFGFRDLHKPIRHPRYTPKPECPTCSAELLLTQISQAPSSGE